MQLQVQIYDDNGHALATLKKSTNGWHAEGYLQGVGYSTTTATSFHLALEALGLTEEFLDKEGSLVVPLGMQVSWDNPICRHTATES